jgi:hypothetical protein
MRQITSRIVSAFLNGERLKIDNTITQGGVIWLWDNMIAERRGNGLWITNAGWPSATTKERLNGLPEVWIVQKKGQWYLNGHAWDGEWVRVADFMGSVRPETEPVFDLTSTWVADGGYSQPNYAVWHSNNLSTLEPVEAGLRELGVPFRRHESDTQGIWRPNYFVVVRPEDFNRVLTNINQ